jgi:hypothetical protein
MYLEIALGEERMGIHLNVSKNITTVCRRNNAIEQLRTICSSDALYCDDSGAIPLL